MQFTMERFLALEERVKDIKESLLALDDRARYLLDENMNHRLSRQNANSRITNAFGKIHNVEDRVENLESRLMEVDKEQRSQNVGDTLTYKMGQQHMKQCVIGVLRFKGYYAAADVVGEM